MIAWYRLSEADKNSLNRTAGPINTTKTPDALGSKVPVWPARRIPVPLRMILTTSWEVIPTGLSTTIAPVMKSFNSSFFILSISPTIDRGFILFKIFSQGFSGSLKHFVLDLNKIPLDICPSSGFMPSSSKLQGDLSNIKT